MAKSGTRDCKPTLGRNHTDENFPTSQEYLATNPKNPLFGYHRVFAWNSFVFQALEMAGLRDPEWIRLR